MMNSIKLKLIFISLLIALVPLLTLGLINMNKTIALESQSAQEKILAIMNLKEKFLEEYIEDTIYFADIIAKSDETQEYFANKDAVDSENLENLENLIYNVQEVNWGRYHHVFVVDTAGKVVLSPNHNTAVKGSPSSHIDSDLASSKWFQDSLSSTQLTDYFTFSEADHYHQLLLHPIKNSNGETIGVLGFELMIEYEQKLLTDNVALGNTGRVLLATLDGVPVVQKKGDELAKLTSPGVLEAIEKGSSIGHTVNEQGVPVIGLYSKNKDFPFIVVAEIEEAEVFSSVNQLKQFFYLGLIITSIIVILLTLLLSGYITRPLKKIASAARQVTDGNLDVELPTWKSNDEIGELISGMEMMIASLRIRKK